MTNREAIQTTKADPNQMTTETYNPDKKNRNHQRCKRKTFDVEGNIYREANTGKQASKVTGKKHTNVQPYTLLCCAAAPA